MNPQPVSLDEAIRRLDAAVGAAKARPADSQPVNFTLTRTAGAYEASVSAPGGLEFKARSGVAAQAVEVLVQAIYSKLKDDFSKSQSETFRLQSRYTEALAALEGIGGPKV